MPYTGISLLLSKAELADLIQMVDAADTEMQTLSIVDLFSAKDS